MNWNDLIIVYDEKDYLLEDGKCVGCLKPILANKPGFFVLQNKEHDVGGIGEFCTNHCAEQYRNFRNENGFILELSTSYSTMEKMVFDLLSSKEVLMDVIKINTDMDLESISKYYDFDIVDLKDSFDNNRRAIKASLNLSCLN